MDSPGEELRSTLWLCYAGAVHNGDVSTVAVALEQLAGLLEQGALPRGAAWEHTARALALWPGASMADDLFGALERHSGDASGDDCIAAPALRALAIILGVQATPRDLARLLALIGQPRAAASASPAGPARSAADPAASARKARARLRLRALALRALEDAARRRAAGPLLGPGAFWSVPGWTSDAAATPPRAGFLSLHFAPTRYGGAAATAAAASGDGAGAAGEAWPFRSHYGVFALVRVARFEPGEGERCTTLLRAISFNGAKLHVWLSERSVHVTVYEPAAAAHPAVLAATASSARDIFGAAKSALGAAQAVATVAAKSMARGTSGGSTHDGHCSDSAAAPSLEEGRWVSIYIDHQLITGMASLRNGGAGSLLRVFVDGAETLTSTKVPFPRALSAAPLALLRVGEGLYGEIGPIYFFDGHSEESARNGPLGPFSQLPLSRRAQEALRAAHSGETVAVVPTWQSVARTAADSWASSEC